PAGLLHRCPAGPEPGERLGGKLVRRLVVVDETAAPAGQTRLQGGEQFGRGLVAGPFQRSPWSYGPVRALGTDNWAPFRGRRSRARRRRSRCRGTRRPYGGRR